MRKLLVGLLALAVCLGLAGITQAGALKLQAAHYFDEDHAYQKGFEKFRDVVKAKSNGTIDVEIYSRGVLGSMKDYMQNMLQGALDVSIVAPASAAGFAKELNFLDLLFLWKDKDHWLRALDGETGRRIAEIIEKATAKGGSPGVKILGYGGASPRHIISRKAGYTTVAELAGFKIRLQESPTQIEMFKLLGTIPAVVPYQETYSAVQTGVVDGLENEMSTAFQMKFYEVAPHFSETGHVLTVRPLLHERPYLEEAHARSTEDRIGSGQRGDGGRPAAGVEAGRRGGGPNEEARDKVLCLQRKAEDDGDHPPSPPAGGQRGGDERDPRHDRARGETVARWSVRAAGSRLRAVLYRHDYSRSTYEAPGGADGADPNAGSLSVHLAHHGVRRHAGLRAVCACRGHCSSGPRRLLASS